MKELTIEEKAKRYDEAIKKAEPLYKAVEPMSGCNVIIETLFPELKESEDKKIRKWIIGVLSTYEHDKDLRNAAIAWLETQGKQMPAEWSKADEIMLSLLHNIIEHHYSLDIIKKDEQLKLEYYLKSLKDRLQPKPKQEWSEEDETALGDALWCCKQAASIAKDENDMGNVWYAENWLKSLRPQNTWKPNDEQMIAIHTAINVLGKGTLNGKQLIELQEQLKKLRGE